MYVKEEIEQDNFPHHSTEHFHWDSSEFVL